MESLAVMIRKRDWGMILGYCCKGLMDLILGTMGPLFVIAATGLISGVIIVHFRAIIPYYFDYWSLAGMIHLLFSAFTSYNIGYNYFMTVFTPPGTTHELMMVDHEELERLKREPAPKRGEGFSRYCKSCKKPKPPRAHHCHICKRCVLRMDHHCPWVGNCVGMFNHKYFFLFVFYLWLGCGYVAAMSFIPFSSSTDFRVPWSGFSSKGTIIFTFVITLSVCLALSFMLGWHLYLIVSGQTTIEFYFNRYRKSQAEKNGQIWHNEFDLGTKKNWQYFFGTDDSKFWFAWLLPSSRPPVGDGTSFPTRGHYNPLENGSYKESHYV